MSVVWAMWSLISISFVFILPVSIGGLYQPHQGENLCVQLFPPAVPLKPFQGLTDKGPLSSSLCLSPPWLCDVLGFVPARSVSSSSTLQIFRYASRFWWLFPLSVYLLSHSLDFVMSRSVHPQGSSKMDVDHCVEHSMHRTGRFTPYHMTCSVLQSTKIYLATTLNKIYAKIWIQHTLYTHRDLCHPTCLILVVPSFMYCSCFRFRMSACSSFFFRTNSTSPVTQWKLNLTRSRTQTAEYTLQDCKNHQLLREEIWLVPAPLHKTLYGPEDALQNTTDFILRAALQV